MAALHTGRIQLDCCGCQNDPSFRKKMGCEEPAQKAVWFDGHDNRFYTCPRRFLTQEILEWYKSYQYYKEFGCAPDYNRQTCRFIDAWMTYKQYYSMYEVDQMRVQQNRPRSVSTTDTY